mgnify:CR=1 FL=1
MEDMDREISGRTILVIALTAFAIVFSANMTLAWFATGTFPGVEVKNSYIASQKFDDLREAQEALGWTTQADYEAGELMVAIVYDDGAHAVANTVELRVGRPTHGEEDQHFSYDWLMTEAQIPVDLQPGQWRIDVKAQAEDGTAYVTRQVVNIRG